MTIIPIHSLKLILKSTLMLVVLGTLTAPVDVLRAGTPQSRPILLVELNAPKVVQYRADDGFMLTARYFSLSDESLHFVKLSMPDRKEYTLPLTLSASGARYADHTLVWWAKGDEAFVEEPNDDGEWKITRRFRKVENNPELDGTVQRSAIFDADSARHSR